MVAQDKPASKACRNMEEDLVLYYYGELADAARGGCEAHLKECQSCRKSLAEMRKLLPMTVAAGEPPPAFWDHYSRELRQKLDVVAEGKNWRRRIVSFLRPVPMPALAVAAMVLLALTLTLGKGLWQPSAPSPDDEAFMEVLPMAEQLDFFSDMELLDNLDLLETLPGQGNGTA